MDPNTLTIKVLGKDATKVVASDAIEALRNAIMLLEEVDRLEPDESRTTWVIVGASMSSPLSLTIRGECQPDVSGHRVRRVVSAMLRSLRMIESEQRRPSLITDRMLRAAGHIGELLENGVANLRFESPGSDAYVPSAELGRRAKALAQQRESYYFTETVLEGRLERIDVHGKPEIYIYDRLSGEPIRCLFRIDAAAELGALITQRVRIRGRTKFTREHEPVSMEVAEFHPVTTEAPSIGDLHERRIDITRGEESVDYVRKLRNG